MLILSNIMILFFGIGPAGTGKTFLAVVMAVQALRNGQVKRIILTRPAVEAGESLGFLPGDLQEKVDPYLRPVYDALFQILGKTATERMMERELLKLLRLLTCAVVRLMMPSSFWMKHRIQQRCR